MQSFKFANFANFANRHRFADVRMDFDRDAADTSQVLNAAEILADDFDYHFRQRKSELERLHARTHACSNSKSEQICF